MKVVTEVLQGIVLSLLYFEVTKANDLNFYNIFVFTTFFVFLTNGAVLVGIDPKIVLNAFITKAIFVLLDERIKKETYKNTPSK